jgi:hypothetical protein
MLLRFGLYSNSTVAVYRCVFVALAPLGGAGATFPCLPKAANLKRAKLPSIT